jgi:single-strand DNA-binding protein
MSRDYNRVQLLGRLGADPDMRFTAGGKPVANLRLAVNSGSGENQSVQWFRVTAWDKLAEIVNQYAGKGSRILVDGRLQEREWTDKENIKRYSTEIIASEVILLSVPAAGRPAAAAGVAAGASDSEESPF